jgi:dienelactone hydrolase
MRSHFLAALALASLFVAASGAPAAGVGRPGINPVACSTALEWQPNDPTFEALPGAKAYFGRYDGGIYHIEIPDKWNGELMLSAHGYVAAGAGRGQQLRVGTPAFRQHLIDEGFAWAASSYRCNGYVPGIGLLDTMSLVDLFTKLNGGRAATRVYLTGTSMGGHVTLLGMHEFPTSFAGGMAMCPSGPELFDFTTAVGAAAEVITGVTFESGNTRDATTRMRTILGEPPAYTEKGRQLASVEIQISGGPRPFAVEGLASRFLSNISGGALAGSTSPSSRAVTNVQYKYRIDEDLGLTSSFLDGAVRRKQPDMEYRGASGPFDELVPFDGKIERPLVTMHGTGDLFVPIHLEQALKRAVDAAGTSNLLVQRIYRIAGHCGFNAAEQARSFDDLVNWVRNGVKPAGDQIMGDLSDAGRQFTSPLRENDPGTIRIPAR